MRLHPSRACAILRPMNNDTHINRTLRPLDSAPAFLVIVNFETIGMVAQAGSGLWGWMDMTDNQMVSPEPKFKTAVEAAKAFTALLEDIINDFRFIIETMPEPELGATYMVTVVAHGSGRQLERFTTDHPYDEVEAAREAQAIPFEERMDMYAERGW